jgi:hypothetical protein
VHRYLERSGQFEDRRFCLNVGNPITLSKPAKSSKGTRAEESFQ